MIPPVRYLLCIHWNTTQSRRWPSEMFIPDLNLHNTNMSIAAWIDFSNTCQWPATGVSGMITSTTSPTFKSGLTSCHFFRRFSSGTISCIHRRQNCRTISCSTHPRCCKRKSVSSTPSGSKGAPCMPYKKWLGLELRM